MYLGKLINQIVMAHNTYYKFWIEKVRHVFHKESNVGGSTVQTDICMRGK